MTPALARVAESVLAQPGVVLYQSITELAEYAKSSEASVMRFCRDLGYSGFQDFKLALARELAVRENLAEAPRSTDAVERLVETAVTALKETERLIDRADLEKAANAFLQARCIEIFGVAASAVTAQYLAYKFARIGLVCRAGQDAHLAMMTAAVADPSIVYVIVSSSGSTIDAVRVAEAAKARGSTVVGISNRSKSPLARLCDIALIASSPETPLTGGAFPSKISQLLIVDALIAAFAKLAPECAETIDATAKAVSDRSY
jgi:DNA-binding MurR/RpiR family transcriptional regulator